MPVCKQCNNDIPIKRARDYKKEFCNRKCVSHYYQKARTSNCQWCQATIQLSKQKYFCSQKCFNESKKSTYYKQCKRCGKDFLCINKAYERRGSAKFCSRSCATRKYSVNEHFFDEINTNEKAYWLGFLYADGYQNGKEIVINLKISDQEHLNNFKKILQSEHPLKEYHSINVVSLRIGSIKLCESLNHLGCVQNKSLIIKFPEFLKQSIFLVDFIRGIFDGDGCIYINKKKRKVLSIYSGSKEFMIELYNIFISHGFNVHFGYQKNGYVLKTGNQLTIKQISSWLYQTKASCLKRKQLKMIDS